jgi:AraC family transcriptional regulator
MLTNSLLTKAAFTEPFNGHTRRKPQLAMLLPSDREPVDRVTSELYDRAAVKVISPLVEISSVDIVKRRAVAWRGMTAEIVQATSHEKIEHHFRAPRHLFAVYEQGVRSDGETFVEGLPRSTLRNLNKKLAFVPAGHEYYTWEKARVLSRVVYFYFDPAKMPILSETGFTDFAPRLYFEDAALLNTALKLATLIENAGADNQLYLEALGIVLAHELARANAGTPAIQAPVRGGLAAWQQRIVTDYIEEHLAEQVSLSTLAQLVRLSPYYFCRAFKQSFSIPPHQYHIKRRIEQAKTLLAKPAPSVTDIGLSVGFQETSSFTAAFRKATGFTPTGYHRSLG